MPTPASMHINQALSNFALQYRQGQTIADQVFPSLPVAKMSDAYYIIDAARNDLKIADDRRGTGGYPNRIDWALSSTPYTVREHVLEDLVTDAEQENADTILEPRMAAVRMLSDRLQLMKEIAACTLCDTMTQTAAATGTTSKWLASDATPIDDIQAAIKKVVDSTGLVPTIGWCDYAVYQALKNSAQVKGAIKTGVATQGELDRIVADVVGLDRILVSRAVKNTSRTGTPSITPVWGKVFYLGAVPPTIAGKTAAFGMTLDWSVKGASGWAVSEMDDRRAKGVWVQTARWYDQVIIANTAGAKLTACIA